MMRRRKAEQPPTVGAVDPDTEQGRYKELEAYASKFQAESGEQTLGGIIGEVSSLQLEPETPSLIGRSISLYWEEKLCMLLGYCQQFALLRLMSPAWPWPPFWRRWTHFTLLFVLDIPSYMHKDLDHFDANRHLTPWTTFVNTWAIGLVALLLCGLWCARSDANVLARRMLLLVSELLYMPALIALPRLLLAVVFVAVLVDTVAVLIVTTVWLLPVLLLFATAR